MAQTRFTDADVAYLRDNYMTLAHLCADRPETPDETTALIEQGVLPRPSYVIEGGTGFFPADYFRLADEAGGPTELREHFATRYRAAAQAERVADDLGRDWELYLGGVWGICLRDVTPETIVRKNALVSSLCELLVLARPNSHDWQHSVRAQVEELDALEREFSPDFDRGDAQERPPTRDLLIAAARERYPDVFADATSNPEAA